ncbi:hypothetical protein LTR95_016636, partial [Oleoguttula sp. CCFEE 5521]
NSTVHNQETHIFASSQHLAASDRLLELRAHHANAKDTRRSLLDHTHCYGPYSEVKSAAIRRVSRSTSASCSFPCPEGWSAPFSKPHGAKLLAKQVRLPEISLDPQAVFLGDLGHYCEDLLCAHQADPADLAAPVTFNVSSGRDDELLRYVLYWDLLLDLFARSRADSWGLGCDLLFRALDSARSDIKVTLQQLENELRARDSTENVIPLLLGAKARVRVFDSFTDNSISSIEREELIEKLIISPAPTAFREDFEARVVTLSDGQKLSPVQTAPVIVTLGMIFIPFALGFAASSASSEIGTKADADYWYNISQTIAVVMGSFMTVLSMRKKVWLSQEYVITWLFLGVGVLCAVLSVVVYPLCNTRWSSTLASFTTIAGFGATLSMTMAEEMSKPRIAPVERSDGKVKAE